MEKEKPHLLRWLTPPLFLGIVVFGLEYGPKDMKTRFLEWAAFFRLQPWGLDVVLGAIFVLLCVVNYWWLPRRDKRNAASVLQFPTDALAVLETEGWQLFQRGKSLYPPAFAHQWATDAGAYVERVRDELMRTVSVAHAERFVTPPPGNPLVIAGDFTVAHPILLERFRARMDVLHEIVTART